MWKFVNPDNYYDVLVLNLVCHFLAAVLSVPGVILNEENSSLRKLVAAAAASEPEANERGSSLISRRLHYRGLQSLFLTKRKELWLCANGRFRMRSGMRKELWLCANGNILGCAVIWRKDLCANGWVRMCSEPCAFLSRFSLFAYILQILTRVSKRL